MFFGERITSSCCQILVFAVDNKVPISRKAKKLLCPLLQSRQQLLLKNRRDHTHLRKRSEQYSFIPTVGKFVHLPLEIKTLPGLQSANNLFATVVARDVGPQATTQKVGVFDLVRLTFVVEDTFGPA